MSNDPNKTFCVLPWIHLATHPMGHVTLCCEADMTNHASSSKDTKESIVGADQQEIKFLGKDTIKEIHDSDYFKRVRKQMLNGEMPEACMRCYNREAKGLDSKRLLEQREYPNYTIQDAINNTNEDGSLKRTDLRFVEFRLGNVCNVKCRTCNPASSNRWKTDYDKLQDGDWDGAKVIPQYRGLDWSTFDWCEEESIYDDILDKCENLESLYINGGEPTLIKQHWRFLDKLIDKGFAKNIKIWYSLNMTNIPDMAFDLWAQFKEVEIRASIDDIEARNTYIRYPTKWNQVLSTMDKCRNTDTVRLKILQTVSVYNFPYLKEFHDFWNEYDSSIDIAHNFVMWPDFMSPGIIPFPIRSQLIKKIESCNTMSAHQKHEIQQLYGSNEHDPEKWKLFLNYTKELDRIRKESFAETFPEFNDLING